LSNEATNKNPFFEERKVCVNERGFCSQIMCILQRIKKEKETNAFLIINYGKKEF
jgi:hypothetical protein